MAYVDSGKKIDKALAFQRTDTFPLDRSSMFASYADALAYAKQDGTDSRAIGGTSYVGQVLTVYGPGDDGATEEVAVYVIKAVGDSAELTKLASTSTTGDLDNDITALQTALNSLQTDVDALETTVGDSTSGLAATKAIADSASAKAATNETAIADLDDRVLTAESDIDTLEDAVSTTIPATYATKTEHNALADRVTTAEGEIDDLQEQITGLTGAMHYIGVSTTDPTGANGATVAGVASFSAGDVVVYNGDSTTTAYKEYVYDGTSWRELGDEGSHLTKTEAAETYVKQTYTVNGHSLTGTSIDITGEDVAVSSSDATTLSSKISSIESSISALDADLSQDITDAIEALDATVTGLGVDKTITALTEENGVISATVSGIQIAQSQVTGLSDALAGKEAAISVTGAGFLKKDSTGAWAIDSNDYQTEAEVETQISTAIGKLDYSVTGVGANQTISSVTETDGVVAVVTQAITGVPIASVSGLQTELDAKVEYTDLDSAEFAVGTANTITIGTIDANKISVSGTALDEKLTEIETNAGKIDTITVNGDATTISNKTVDIPLATAAKYGVVKSVETENGVTVASDGTMSVYSLNVSKLVQTDGDTLIIDGGDAAGSTTAA